MSSLKREEIVDHAFKVLYKEGFHATGVDRLMQETGISKRTLYKYFRSKEELIIATVQHYQKLTFNTLESELSKRCKDPRSKLLAIFDLREEALARGDYSGCFATNAFLEYDGKYNEIEAASGGFMIKMNELLLRLCTDAKFINPGKLARQIAVILEGTIVLGQCLKDASLVSDARAVVEMLLDSSNKLK
jgi:AcrR family transcriptional regulator